MVLVEEGSSWDTRGCVCLCPIWFLPIQTSVRYLGGATSSPCGALVQIRLQKDKSGGKRGVGVEGGRKGGRETEKERGYITVPKGLTA